MLAQGWKNRSQQIGLNERYCLMTKESRGKVQFELQQRWNG